MVALFGDSMTTDIAKDFIWKRCHIVVPIRRYRFSDYRIVFTVRSEPYCGDTDANNVTKVSHIYISS